MYKFTKEQWQTALELFRAGNYQVNYIIRCFTVGDEEEYQVGDNDDGLHKEGIMALYDELPFGVWQWICKKVWEWFNCPDSNARDAIRTGIIYRLKPFMTCKEFYEQQDVLWEALFWSADDKNSTYEEFVKDWDY